MEVIGDHGTRGEAVMLLTGERGDMRIMGMNET